MILITWNHKRELGSIGPLENPYDACLGQNYEYIGNIIMLIVHTPHITDVHLMGLW